MADNWIFSFFMDLTNCIAFKGSLNDLEQIIDFKIHKKDTWDNTTKFLFNNHLKTYKQKSENKLFFIASPVIEEWTILCFKSFFAQEEQLYLSQKISQSLGKIITFHLDQWSPINCWTIFQKGKFIYRFKGMDDIIEVYGNLGEMEQNYIKTQGFSDFNCMDIISYHLFDFANYYQDHSNRYLESTICILNEPLKGYNINILKGFCQYIHYAPNEIYWPNFNHSEPPNNELPIDLPF